MDHEKLIRVVGTEWAKLLKPFMVKEHGATECPYDAIISYLKEEQKNGNIYYPEGQNVLRCFKETPLETVKVILLGQDPYPRAGFANGLAFGTDNKDTPPSLKMIFEGLEKDVYDGLDFDVNIKDKTLGAWAQQGVLLLNTALTVKAEDPGSHSKIWLPFTEYLIKAIQEVKKDIVWIGLGAPAREVLKDVNVFRNFVFLAEHPANAGREKRTWKHNNVFTKTNLAIKMNQLGEEIEW